MAPDGRRGGESESASVTDKCECAGTFGRLCRDALALDKLVSGCHNLALQEFEPPWIALNILQPARHASRRALSFRHPVRDIGPPYNGGEAMPARLMSEMMRQRWASGRPYEGHTQESLLHKIQCDAVREGAKEQARRELQRRSPANGGRG